MSALDAGLRRQLEKTVAAARDLAQSAAEAAFHALAVDAEQPFASLGAAERELRDGLRAESDRLGGLPSLVGECAYHQWHRLLFGRFLAENDLLVHPTSRVAVSLAECEELAREQGTDDRWDIVTGYAAQMLPGIFDNDAPAQRLRLAADHRVPLEKLLTDLPVEIFTADDSLGWVYQFWQSRRKDAVNKSADKVSGADISAVTQLFTEHYMVQFLLHNSLGAWWAARRPEQSLPSELSYLRRNDDGTPAAGSFAGWPNRAADLKVLDPCCGSGHFLVAAFSLLLRLRMEEEGLGEAEAGDAVLRDNLHGLELDARCAQIAAFNLALTAWKHGGYRDLPPLRVACSGLAVGSDEADWTGLAGDDANLRHTLQRLYKLFHDAPDLGSLIDPRRAAGEGGLFADDWKQVGPLLDKALEKRKDADPAATLFGTVARDALSAAQLLGGEYHLVVTNVPYLARGKQGRVLADFCQANHPAAKADLATVFIERCLSLCARGGVVALVTPQNWLFLGSYKKLRQNLLSEETWNMVARLGPGAFETIGGEVVNVALSILTHRLPDAEHQLAGLDASAPRVPAKKAELLRSGEMRLVSQAGQLGNPDARVTLEADASSTLLSQYADSFQGVSPADLPHYGRYFWEVHLTDEWIDWQGSVEATNNFSGRQQVLWWGEDFLNAVSSGNAYVRSKKGWEKDGVVVSAMRNLPVTLYSGEATDTNVAAIVPYNPTHLPAIWAFCSSPEFNTAVRRIDQALKVTNASLVKVPFDLDHWQKIADERYPNGLPEPYSNDPTQWLFEGHPTGSTDPLQVGVARLLGYRWPQQGEDDLDGRADPDGIVCLPPVSGELPAHERLRAFLATAFGYDWSPETQARLLTEAGFADKTLEEWLRDGFFAAHCKLFGNRPFIWQLWDGRRDGFSVLVNYHRLNAANLQKLTYVYLGDWIAAQRDDNKQGVPGAEARLLAARELQAKLELIAQGEPPHDIYVRWKQDCQQPIGWEPDLNDGVRLNIRPFVTAGVLRRNPNIKWGIDRGTNPDGTTRDNDRHLSRARKEEARRIARL